MPVKLPSEKRRHSRVRWDLHVTVKGPDGRDSRLLSYDWTGTSVLLRTNEPYPAGTAVELAALVGRPARQVKLAGSVTRLVRQDPVRPQSPQGMVIIFKELPVELRQALLDLTRIKGAPVSEVVAAVRAVPAALVISADRLFSVEASRALNRAGYDATAADDADHAKALLESRLRPKVWLISADGAMGVPPLLRRFSVTNPPELVLVVGEPPADLGRGTRFPIVILPQSWSMDRLPEVVAGFLSTSAARGGTS